MPQLAAALKHRYKIERGFSVQNIGELLSDTEGKSPEKKKLIKAILDDWERAPVSVVGGRPESVVVPVELRDSAPEYLTSAQWQERARQLQEENARLKKAMRELLQDATSSKTDAAAVLHAAATVVEQNILKKH